MDDKKTILDYIGQVFLIFGVLVAVLMLLCLLFGKEAQQYSDMFQYGNNGFTLYTLLQFFLLAVFITGINYLFHTAFLTKRLNGFIRMVGILVSFIILIAVFVLVFNWFPVNLWQPWALFFLCFGLSFGISTVITTLKEKMDNKKMNEALQRLKQKE